MSMTKKDMQKEWKKFLESLGCSTSNDEGGRPDNQAQERWGGAGPDYCTRPARSGQA
jgi:hypothetical protein